MAVQNKCTVVNLRKESYDVYIGRPSEFGNPYSVQKFGREGCIEMYRTHFECRILNDLEFRSLILSVAGKRLGCFCSPLTCHGNVIADWVNGQCCSDQGLEQMKLW